MVSQDRPSSRADSLELVGGELALDFANTCSGRGAPSFQDHLHRPEHVALWAGHARILKLADAEWLAQAAVSDGALGERLLREALALREDVFQLGVATAARRLLPPERINSLTRTHALALAKGRLTPVGESYCWSWEPAQTPVEAITGPISLSALTLLQQADLTRVKQCEGERCGWLFFDATKNRSRRWCEMEICGNRAKQKRFVGRKRSVQNAG